MRGQDIAIIFTGAIFGGLMLAFAFGFFSEFKYFWVTWIGAAAVLSRMLYLFRKSDTKCEKCGASWSLSETRREDIETKRTFEITGHGDNKKKVWKDVTNYWQYWTCDKCSNVTRTREKREKKVGDERIA